MQSSHSLFLSIFTDKHTLCSIHNIQSDCQTKVFIIEGGFQCANMAHARKRWLGATMIKILQMVFMI